MSYGSKGSGLRRQEAVGMDKLVDHFIRQMKLSSGLKKQRAAEAWNAVSGAGRYTLSVNLYKGVMTCTLSSSVVRNQLYLQREGLLQALNDMLMKDELFFYEGKYEKINILIFR